MQFKNLVKLSLLSFLLLANTIVSKACSCEGWPLPFCAVTSEFSTVSLVRIIDVPEDYLMYVEVIEEINLELTKDTVLVVGQDGLNCGENLTQFTIGDSLIVNLVFVNNDSFFYGADYVLDGCNINYLRYQNGQVAGDSYTTFVENFQDCIDTVLSDDPTEVDNTLDLYPTIVNDRLHLSSKLAPIETVHIYSASGKLVLEQEFHQKQFDLSLNHLLTGIYFVRIKIGDSWLVRKVVRQ